MACWFQRAIEDCKKYTFKSKGDFKSCQVVKKFYLLFWSIKGILGIINNIHNRIYIFKQFDTFFAYCQSHIKISIYKVAVVLDCNYVGRVLWAYTFRNKINASSRLPMCRLVRYILFWSKYNHMHLLFVLYVTTVFVVSPQNIFFYFMAIKYNHAVTFYVFEEQ